MNYRLGITDTRGRPKPALAALVRFNPLFRSPAEMPGDGSRLSDRGLDCGSIMYNRTRAFKMLMMEFGLTLVDIHDDPGVSTYYLTRKSS